MSIIDKVTSHVSGVLGKGPPGLPSPHNTSWGTAHASVHGGVGQAAFPGQGAPGNGGRGPDGLGPPGLSRPSGLFPAPPPGVGRPVSPGLAPAPDRPAGPAIPSPGIPSPGADRPNGNGWGPAPDRPAPATVVPGQGAERPSSLVPGQGAERPSSLVPGQGAERPSSLVPGQGAERPSSLVPGQVVQGVFPPGPSGPPAHAQQHPAAQAPGHTGNTGQAGAASAMPGAQQSGLPLTGQAQMAQSAPMPLPTAAAPRADAGAALRTDVPAQGAQIAQGVRAEPAHPAPRTADAALVTRQQDPALATQQQRSPAFAPSTAANTAATTAPSTTPAAQAATATLAAATTATVAGSTMANAPPATAPVAEARNAGNPLAVNDRGAPARPDAAGYTGTGEGPQRRSLDRRTRVAGGGLSALLAAMGAQGHTGASGRDPAALERELRETTMQWLFWLLALIAYGCLGFAIIALLPVGGQVLGDSARTWTGGSALLGLLTAAVAWLVAKRLGTRRT